MAVATDADFNADSRQLDFKLEIFFDGPSSAPVTLSKSDYLVDSSWIEEMFADSNSIMGSITSNELMFTLDNSTGIFSPTNAAGPYYGKIKKGVAIKPYILPAHNVAAEWYQLGEYYVTNWNAAIGESSASVRANDKWYSILNGKGIMYNAGTQNYFADIFYHIFEYMNVDVEIDDKLYDWLTYYDFVTGTPKEFLQSLATGSMAFFTVTNTGLPQVKAVINDRELRATLTDDDQIKTITATQLIEQDYDGIEITYYTANAKVEEESALLLSLNSIAIPSGTTLVPYNVFTLLPVYSVSHVMLMQNTDDNAGSSINNMFIDSYSVSCEKINFTITNNGYDNTCNIEVYGSNIALTAQVLTDNTDMPLKVDSKYIQDLYYANVYKGWLTKQINCLTPVLKLETRGNPCLSVGQKIHIDSVANNLSFDGVIARLEYAFNGGLSCNVTLFNNDFMC